MCWMILAEVVYECDRNGAMVVGSSSRSDVRQLSITSAVVNASVVAVLLRTKMSSVNYPGYDYPMFHMPSSYSMKLDDSCLDCDDSFQSGMPYANFNKPAHSGAILYTPMQFDHSHPFYFNQRRRSPELYEPLDLDTSVSPPLPPFQQREYNRALKTKIDPRRCSDDELYSNHFTEQPNDENISSDRSTKRKVFSCPTCVKTFKFQTSLLRHNNKTHNFKYQCHKCQRRFSRQAYLDTHTSKQGSSCFLGVSTRVSRPARDALIMTSPGRE